MSSHHIVRDEQEPALLVIDPLLLRQEAVASLLEWNPTILVPCSELDQLGSWGIKPDVVLASPEERDLAGEWKRAFPTLQIVWRLGEDSLSQTALRFLQENRYSAVNIMLGSSALLPTALLNQFPSMDIVFFRSENRFWRARNGAFRKWLAAGGGIRIHPGESTFFTVEADGQQNKWRAEDPFPIHNVTDGMVAVSAESPFWVEEPL